jgi:DNA-directed RNA polymerase specialized sigma24 family protein
MTKEELIILLKEHKENVAKLRLRKKEKRYYENKLNAKPHIETSISSSLGINADIRSKNSISDKVGDAVVKELTKIEEEKEEAKAKIAELEPIIQELEDKVEEAEIRLNCLYYKEREVLTAYYVENRTAEDISQNLYFKLFSRTCSPRYIRILIQESTEKILKL